MARSISEEEIQLKKRARRRLVGAIVLVAVVAVVLPMVLDSEPKKPNGNVEIQIPSPDSGVFNPKIAPSAPIPERKPAADVPPPKTDSSAPKAAATAPTAAPVPAAPEEKREQPTAVESSPKNTAKSGEPAKSAEPAKSGEPAKTNEHATASAHDGPKTVANGKFVVQIAALADAAKAKKLQQQVAHGGLKSYTEVVKTAKGSVTRVRAGPYATREAAEKARAHLKAAGLDGKVVPR